MPNIFERVGRVLDKHLPPPKNPKHDNESASLQIVAAAHHPSGGFEVWDIEKQRARLRKLDDLLKRAQHEYSQLHPTLSFKILCDANARWDDLSFHAEEERAALSKLGRGRIKNRPWVTTSPDIAIKALPKISDALRESFAVAWRAAKQGDPAGKRDWRAAGVCWVCCEVWEARTDRRQPQKRLNPATPLASFIRDIFEVLEIGRSPVSAFRAMIREVHSEG